jgi:hypothetical protein
MPSQQRIPNHWRNEASGVLRPVVEAYLLGADMTPEQIAIMRVYLRQFMQAGWTGDGVPKLRRDVETLRTRADVEAWMRRANAMDIDPL